MGQLGFQELAVIFLIALLVFGPKKLPELGKSLGKGLREFKRATNDLKASWDEQVRESEIADAAKEFRTIRRDVDADLREATRQETAAGKAPEASTPAPGAAAGETPAEKPSEAPSEKPS